MVEKIKKRRKVLVTGSSGMLGTALCKVLSYDYDIVGLDISFASGNESYLSEFVKCDITEKEHVSYAINTIKPDFIIHLACWTDVDGCEREPDRAKRINIDGTENVIIPADRFSTPFIYLSTDFVFDGRKNLPYKEEDKTAPLNVYGMTKLESEREVMKLKKYIIIRTSWLYGKNGRNFVDTVLEIANKKKKLRVVNDQIGSPTYVKDLSGAIKAILEKLESSNQEFPDSSWGIFHISNKGAVSWFDYAKEILKLMGFSDTEIVAIKSSQLNRPAKRPSFSVLDNSKFEKKINFSMRLWKEALSEYLNEKKSL